MMKRLSIIVVALLACATLALAACAAPEEEESFVGHWSCTAVDAGNGEVISVNEIEGSEMTGDDLMSFELFEDGTAVLSTFGSENEAETLTWKESDNRDVEIITSGGESMVLTYNAEDKTLLMNVSGQKLYFSHM